MFIKDLEQVVAFLEGHTKKLNKVGSAALEVNNLNQELQSTSS